MAEIEFLDDTHQPTQIKELEGEQNYYNEIKRLESVGKIVKLGKVFENKDSALSYIKSTPSRKSCGLSKFIPETDWVIGGSSGEVKAVAFSREIRGERVDKLVSDEVLAENVMSQLDEFIAESLLIYEKEGVCPGVNLKNFVVDEGISCSMWIVNLILHIQLSRLRWHMQEKIG